MRVFLRVLNGLVTVLLILLVLATAGLAISARRSRDQMPTILGHKVLTVLSGSMAPTIRTGDVIVVQPLTAGGEVHEGDVVTFRERSETNMLITHRIVGTVLVNGRVSAYVTKGDANDAQDSTLLQPEQIVGLYRWRIPYFGYVVSFLHKPLGIILAVVFPGLILIGMEIRQLWQAAAEAESARPRGGEGPQA